MTESETQALICLRVCKADGHSSTIDNPWKSSITLVDDFKKVAPQPRFVVELGEKRYFVLLSDTSQSRTLLTARLCRNVFQRRELTSNHTELSIGALLFKRHDFSAFDLVAFSSRMASKARTKGSSSIVLYNNTKKKVY